MSTPWFLLVLGLVAETSAGTGSSVSRLRRLMKKSPADRSPYYVPKFLRMPSRRSIPESTGQFVVDLDVDGGNRVFVYRTQIQVEGRTVRFYAGKVVAEFAFPGDRKLLPYTALARYTQKKLRRGLTSVLESLLLQARGRRHLDRLREKLSAVSVVTPPPEQVGALRTVVALLGQLVEPAVDGRRASIATADKKLRNKHRLAAQLKRHICHNRGQRLHFGWFRSWRGIPPKTDEDRSPRVQRLFTGALKWARHLIWMEAALIRRVKKHKLQDGPLARLHDLIGTTFPHGVPPRTRVLLRNARRDDLKKLERTIAQQTRLPRVIAQLISRFAVDGLSVEVHFREKEAILLPQKNFFPYFRNQLFSLSRWTAPYLTTFNEGIDLDEICSPVPPTGPTGKS